MTYFKTMTQNYTHIIKMKNKKCDICGVEYVRFVVVDLKDNSVKYICGEKCLKKIK